MTEESEFESQQGQECFLFSKAIKFALLPFHTQIQWLAVAFIPGVKQMGREGYHTLPYSTKVNNVCSYMSTPHVLMAW